MNVILKTKCGCSREFDCKDFVGHTPPRVIHIPIMHDRPSTFAKVSLNAMVTISKRLFVFDFKQENGKFVYVEELKA